VKREAARLNAERERGLFERQLTTARENEEARAALQQQDALAAAASERVRALGGTAVMGRSRLRAPMAGFIAERAIQPGQNVASNLVAFRIGDLDALWVLLRLFERHVALVRPGDAVDIQLLSEPKQIIHGTVAHVGSVLDETTRTTDVRVEVTNESRLLRPGQAVEARIRASGPARVALAVPASAVTYVDGSPTVFVAETDTRFTARKVELGLDGGDLIELASGVREGEAVVSRSVLALKSELFR
jgi:membrane fusion protein, heavy metal efflux system